MGGLLFDPLDIILIFALLTFFLNRQKSFIPPQSKYEKKKFILRKSVAQELLIEKIDHYKLKRKTTKKYQCLSNNKCQPVITTYLKKTKTPPTLEQKKVKRTNIDDEFTSICQITIMISRET